MYGKIRKVHFVGIGGIGMSGVAEVLINMGYEVSGSDLKRANTIERLERLGARIFIGHDPKNLSGAQVVVVSSAIKRDNPEVVKAFEEKIPVIPRAEMLAELMKLKYSVAVAGSHGKTTTTSLISTVLSQGGFDPTIVVGGRVIALGTNARLGNGAFMVAETDESDGSFLMLSPTITVVTNVDREHLDYYGTMSSLKEAFLDFINKVPFYGLSILCLDCPNIRELIPSVRKRYLTYGFSTRADLRAQNIEVLGLETNFKVLFKNSNEGNIRLRVPGRHNAQNALAAVAVGMELGMKFDDIMEGLDEFRGIERRLQVKGRVKDVLFIDDYGHHPEEIRATLSTLKESLGKRLIVIFQPHRYSRTRLLFESFSAALSLAEALIVLDIYSAGEDIDEGVSAESLARSMKEKGHPDVAYLGDWDKAIGYVLGKVRPGDAVITLGAGDVWKIGEMILCQMGGDNEQD